MRVRPLVIGVGAGLFVASTPLVAFAQIEDSDTTIPFDDTGVIDTGPDFESDSALDADSIDAQGPIADVGVPGTDSGPPLVMDTPPGCSCRTRVSREGANIPFATPLVILAGWALRRRRR